MQTFILHAMTGRKGEDGGQEQRNGASPNRMGVMVVVLVGVCGCVGVCLGDEPSASPRACQQLAVKQELLFYFQFRDRHADPPVPTLLLSLLGPFCPTEPL